MSINRLILFLALFSTSVHAASWWNPKWPIRKQFTIDATDTGAKITDAIGTSAVLVRLHDGNFQFLSAREDGSDIRFIAADDKTELSYHIEKFDGLLNEAYVWVKVPDLKPAAQTNLWLYYGNVEDAVKKEDAKGTFDADTALVYHFFESSGPPLDSTSNGLKAETAGVPVGGALIGSAVRLTGQAPITIPASTTLDLAAGASFTFSSWIKPLALQPNAVIFAKREGNNALLIGDNNGVPYVEVVSGGSAQRSAAGAPITVNVWRHLAVVASSGTITLYLDGKSYGTLSAALPALKGPTLLGKDTDDAPGFSGELDELQIAKIARPAGWIAFAAINQGSSSEAQKLLVAGNDESSDAEHSELSEHLSLFADISKSLTFDGWVVIALCAILAVVGWFIAIGKLIYLNKINKASKVFLELWENVSTDITALDHADENSVKTLGGNVTGSKVKLIRQSPLFHLYHIGSQEIQKRITAAGDGKFGGLSGRSIAAIRAVLDGGQVREVQKLNSKLVFLTIGIAGGPYLGLLGTVIGVMITFAVIAQSGEVEINSIAPGIAGALLATVAGLAVAIPALFAYSYLSTRIKDAVSSMHIFIDEFVARIAEAYPTANE
jgi:biopolymer transport protein ExbB